jgi:soluble lytic murein transglycosylase
MQLMEGTAVELAGGGRPDRLDPETSLRLGARYLREQLDRFAGYPCGDELALAAYNAGPGRVKKWLAERPLQADRERLGAWIPFRETRNYVRRVAAWRERWELELESSR